MREHTVKDAHFRQRFDKACLRHRHIRTGRGVTYSSSSLIRCLAIPDIQGREAKKPHVFGVYNKPTGQLVRRLSINLNLYIYDTMPETRRTKSIGHIKTKTKAIVYRNTDKNSKREIMGNWKHDAFGGLLRDTEWTKKILTGKRRISASDNSFLENNGIFPKVLKTVAGMLGNKYTGDK